MVSEDWKLLCPEYQFGNASPSSAEIWDVSVDDLTFCYHEVFQTISHSFFLIISAFYIGRISRKTSTERTELTEQSTSRRAQERTVSISWGLRCFVSLAVVILHFLSLILQLVWLKDRAVFGLISYVWISVSLLTWLLHASLTWSLARTKQHTIDGADSLLLILSWMPVFLISSLGLRSVLMGHTPNDVHRIISIVIFSLQLLYVSAGVLELYSSCIFVGSASEKRLLPGGGSARSSVCQSEDDEENLINDGPEEQPIWSGAESGAGTESGTESRIGTESKLGEPNFFGILRFLLFLWVEPLMRNGAEGLLRGADDLFELPKNLGADQHAESLQKELARSTKNSKFYLPKILVRIWGLKWLLLGFMKLAYSFLQYTSPLFVSVLVETIENPGSKPEYYGYLYGFGLILVNLISPSVQLHYAFQVEKLALCIRGALVDSVYGKLLRVHTSALSESMGSGQVVNLVGNDCQKVAENCQYLHQMWAMPLQIGVALYLLYQQVGFAFIGGLIFTILLVPLNQILANKISQQVEENLEKRDSRIKLMSEALNSIRVIKFHAWEKWFCQRVGLVRATEMKTVKIIKYLDALCVYFWATTPLIMSVLTFTTFVLMGNTLTAAKVFTCLSVFGLVIVPLNAIPWIITGTVEAWISAKRLQKFFKLSEIDLNTYYSVSDSAATLGENETAVEIREGSFTWIPQKENLPGDPSSTASSNLNSDVNSSSNLNSDSSLNLNSNSEERKNQLEKINLKIKRGELVGVVGKVGSGKSSLLNAIVAEIYQTDGQVEISKKELSEGFGYVPQDNWIQQGTVRSNIQFSLPHSDSEFYHNVVEACALEQDLHDLPAGDRTQIGEHGVTLSGGQRARISLARAVMQNKEIILMDDPLSAVDAQVANHIFDKCIVKFLAGKTRILVTHHVDFLRSVDRVIVLKNGQILENDSPKKVLPKFSSFEVPFDPKPNVSESETEDETKVSPTQADRRGRRRKKRREKTSQLISEEQREFGTVQFSVYKQYWKAVGDFWAVAVFLSLFAMQASYNVTDWWLSYWVTHEHISINPVTNATESDYKYYLIVYGSIGAGNSVFAFFRCFVFAYAGLRAAYRMHDLLLIKVMRGRMNFFDSTPSGRILNRFAKDVTSVDNQLPFMVNIILACLFQLLGTLVVICYGLPWFILVLVPLAPLYYFIQRYYRETSREIKRINSLTQSPIYSLYTETLHGLSTIRAMRADAYFYAKYKKLLDENLRAQFSEIASNKWLTMRLQFLGMVIVSGVVVIALLLKSAAGTLGLTVSYSLTIVGILNNFVTSLIETEKEMVSVERIMQYLADIEEEKYDGIFSAPPDWPKFGSVEFKNISLRYREDLPAVLSDFTLHIKAGERIGVVGRTGAGKSSFLVTLFRMAEINQGSISIDGVDISHLALEQLRSRLAIIPQTPSLFDASIRDNLDPLHKASDDEIWSVIDMCDLRGTVEKLGGHLEIGLGENGRKLSLGQKQLVCLARALLSKARIICLDEATASVDYETDNFIQETLRKIFKNTTIITIAHRLKTVMDYDRIVVMSEGRIVECDTPQNLLATPTSHFAMLHQQSQRTSSDF